MVQREILSQRIIQNLMVLRFLIIDVDYDFNPPSKDSGIRDALQSLGTSFKIPRLNMMPVEDVSGSGIDL